MKVDYTSAKIIHSIISYYTSIIFHTELSLQPSFILEWISQGHWSNSKARGPKGMKGYWGPYSANIYYPLSKSCTAYIARYWLCIDKGVKQLGEFLSILNIKYLQLYRIKTVKEGHFWPPFSPLRKGRRGAWPPPPSMALMDFQIAERFRT